MRKHFTKTLTSIPKSCMFTTTAIRELMFTLVWSRSCIKQLPALAWVSVSDQRLQGNRWYFSCLHLDAWPSHEMLPTPHFFCLYMEIDAAHHTFHRDTVFFLFLSTENSLQTAANVHQREGDIRVWSNLHEESMYVRT